MAFSVTSSDIKKSLSVSCSLENSISGELGENEEEPPMLTDSEDEAPRLRRSGQGKNESGDETSEAEENLELENAYKLAMRESLPNHKMGWAVHLNRKTKRQHVKKRVKFCQNLDHHQVR